MRQVSACAVCSRQTILKCGGCKDVPGPKYSEIYYCSTACQTADWANHKRKCKGLQTRRKLYQAGELLQELFYMYREVMYDKNVTNVFIVDEQIRLVEGSYPDVTTSDIEHIFNFPSHLFPNPLDKDAALTHLACTDAIAWMHDAVVYVLRNIADTITEWMSMTQTPKREVIAVYDGTIDQHHEYQHHFWVIELENDGGKYVLDLAGAQYGYFEPVIPSRDYYRDRVQVNLSDHILWFGATKARLEKEMNEEIKVGATGDEIASITARKATCRINSKASQAMMMAIRIWEAEIRPISGMFKRSDAEFDDDVSGLVLFSRRIIRLFQVSCLVEHYDKMQASS